MRMTRLQDSQDPVSAGSGRCMGILDLASTFTAIAARKRVAMWTATASPVSKGKFWTLNVFDAGRMFPYFVYTGQFHHHVVMNVAGYDCVLML